MLLKYFPFVSICKYSLTAGLLEQEINVTQSWPGILKFRQLCYLQRSYPSAYKRYSPIAFIITSIEDSSSMPDPAPQPQEQPPQVPRPPQDAVVQNIVASATPAGDTPTTPDQLEVHVVLAFPLSFILFCFARVRIGLSRPLPSWSFIRFVSPFISFMVQYSASSFYSVFLVLSSFS